MKLSICLISILFYFFFLCDAIEHNLNLHSSKILHAHWSEAEPKKNSDKNQTQQVNSSEGDSFIKTPAYTQAVEKIKSATQNGNDENVLQLLEDLNTQFEAFQAKSKSNADQKQKDEDEFQAEYEELRSSISGVSDSQHDGKSDGDDDDDGITDGSLDVPAGSQSEEITNKKIDFHCLKALSQCLPPTFCWVNKIYIPSICPTNYPFHVFGACHQQKKLFSKFLSPKNKKVLCKQGDEKKGPLCHASKACSNLKYIDCGPLGCARDKTSCKTEIMKMVRSSVTGVLKFTTFVLTMGASAGVASMAKVLQAVQQIGKFVKAIATAMQVFEQVIIALTTKTSANEFAELKEKMIEAAIPKVKTGLESEKIPAPDDAKIKEKLNYVFDNLKKVKEDTQGIKQETLTALKSAANAKIQNIKACFNGVIKKNPSQNLSEMQCWKDYIVPILKLMDPTGIVGLVSAFVYPKCPKNIQDFKITTKL